MSSTPMHQNADFIHDVLIVGAGPCGLAVAARLRERHPSALFTDAEQARYSWIAQNSQRASIKNSRTGRVRSGSRSAKPINDEPTMLVLDSSGAKWMAKWHRLFNTFGISHLRSPMFFHPDPQDRDSLLSYAYANGRAKELEEITGCVGKEISKHRRKKERAGCKHSVKAKPIVTIDERDRKDYYTPSTAVFHDFCDSCIHRYGLEKEHTIKQEDVQNIDYGTVPGSNNDDIFTVQTNDSVYHARVVVLAIGAGAPTIPRPFASDTREGACHAMKIQKHKGMLLDPSVKIKSDCDQPTNVLVIGGGLTSAQIADALVRTGAVSKVWLFMRGPWKIRPFDVDLSWIAKFKNHQQASFWSADTDEERMEYVKEARNGGSMTPRYAKVLKRHIQSNKLIVQTHTTVKSQSYCPDTQSWNLQTEPSIEDMPRFDYVYFATGAQTDIDSLGYLKTIRDKAPIKTCGGLPILTDDLKWSPEVPLFVTGKLATLRLGPGAGNLEGARAGAERVAWAIQDTLRGRGDKETDNGEDENEDMPSFARDYIAGVGSRFESLQEYDCDA